jgi:hypothetical protein
MSDHVIFFRRHGSSGAAELLDRGYSRRTTATEPRLSELVAEYRRIGFDVQVVEHQVEAADCGVCYEAGAQGGEICGDIYVRRKPADGTGAAGESDDADSDQEAGCGTPGAA